MKSALTLGAIGLIGGLAYAYWPASQQQDLTTIATQNVTTALASVTLPDAFSPNAQIGQRVFEAKCAACHGINAVGQDGVAPPLVHKIYEPSHHGDESFQRAAVLGVRAHHWRFGDMPPVEGITPGDVTMIIAYVRELQRANGIN